MKTSAGKIRFGAVAALCVIAFAAMATIAMPSRPSERNAPADPVSRSHGTRATIDKGPTMRLAANTDASTPAAAPQMGQMLLPPPSRPFAIPSGAPSESEPAAPPAARRE